MKDTGYNNNVAGTISKSQSVTGTDPRDELVETETNLAKHLEGNVK